ncbi:MAG: putative PEP-binding protein [Nitrososphaeraceae archaeon]
MVDFDERDFDERGKYNPPKFVWLNKLDTVPVKKTTCNEFGVETSICGESGSSVDIARILVKYGIKSISCNIDAIDTIRAVVYQEEQEED